MLSATPVGVQLTAAPEPTVAEVLPATTAEHDALLQSWKSTVPLSVRSESTNVAPSCVVLTRAAAAGESSVGVPGGTVSTTQYLWVDHVRVSGHQ